MIQNAQTAKKVSDILLDVNGRLNECVALVADSGSPEENRLFRRAAGLIINEIFERILEPIYRVHPDIKPAGLEMP